MFVSAPAKLILFGEWGVTRGGTAVGTSLSTRFFLRCEEQLPWECQFSGISNHESAQAFFERLLELGQWPKRGRWTTSMEFRDVEGLGSSSALVSCLVRILEPHGTLDELWLRSRSLIQASQNPKASGFDAGLQIWGGSQVLRGSRHWSRVKLTHNPRVMLVHTGAKISTASALSSLSPKEVWVRRLSDSAEGFLKDQNWTDAMNEHDQLLRELGVVPKECQELLQYWKQKKWIEAGKTTGAGGGDALLLYVVPEALRALQEDVEKRGFWFQRATWESEGLRVEKAQ